MYSCGRLNFYPEKKYGSRIQCDAIYTIKYAQKHKQTFFIKHLMKSSENMAFK